jgi:membrane fusion protein, multidrug efflux system
MRTSRAMGTDRARAFLGGASLLAAVALAACGSPEATGNEAEPAGGAAYVKVVNVVARTVEPTDFTSYVRITGNVEAYEDVVVSSQESGVIERVLVDKGSRVRAGQALLKIDDRTLIAQVKEAQANAALARERFERQRQLWEDEGIGSEITFLQTRYESESADARLDFLEARLARHTIASPITGVLEDRFVDVGEIVAPGTPVVRVLTPDRLKVVGGVPERFGPWIAKGGAAVLSFDVLPGQVFEGKIDNVGAAVDPQNRTFRIEILLDNPEGRLKPQMVANVRVATERLEGVIVVPQDVVVRTEDGYQAFVVADGPNGPVAEARVVTLGPRFENEVVIEKGLTSGDRLIVTGHQMVDAGDRVREVKEEEAR